MNKIRVIIVDDIEFMINGIKSDLEKYENIEIVGTATNKIQCFGLLRQTEVDVILMDYDFRGADYNGADLTKEILTTFPNVKVVIISAYDDFTFVHKAIKNGAVGYIGKYNRDSLLLGIMSAMEGKVYADSVILEQIWYHLRSSLLTTEASKSNYTPLTPTEKKVVEGLVIRRKFSQGEIGDDLSISKDGAKYHVHNIAVKWKLSGSNLILKIWLRSKV